MDKSGKVANSKSVSKGVFTERRINGIGPNGPYGDAATNTMNMIPTEELKRRNESMLENIGVLRFSIAKIEQLEKQRHEFIEMLLDVRPILQATGYKDMDARIAAFIDLVETQW